jgi:peptidoglycan/xylan/chitin deacetylase (PgdA/CDA1 family)
MSVYRGGRPAERSPAAGQKPPSHRRGVLLLRFLVAVALLALLVNMLLVEAYLGNEFTPDSATRQVRPVDAVPAAVLSGGPVIDLSGTRPLTYRMPERTLALTFDDGPDPRWTPQILDVLRRRGVHDTFFVIGSRVTRNTGLTRQIIAEGHEIGTHSFTHPTMSALPTRLRGLEQSASQGAVAYATGRSASLYRPPYSSVTDALDNTDMPTLRETARRAT